MQFKDFLLANFPLNENSADDYVGRLNGILERKIYNGEKGITPSLKAAVEREFPKSKDHYLLTLKRYIKFQKIIDNQNMH